MSVIYAEVISDYGNRWVGIIYINIVTSDDINKQIEKFEETLYGPVSLLIDTYFLFNL